MLHSLTVTTPVAACLANAPPTAVACTTSLPRESIIPRPCLSVGHMVLYRCPAVAFAKAKRCHRPATLAVLAGTQFDPGITSTMRCYDSDYKFCPSMVKEAKGAG
eukprot:1752703-Amphidinium_carterae.1